RSAPPAAGTLAVGRRRGTARAAQARGDPPLPDRPDRAAVAALRQGVERGNPTAARSARQASGHARAREPDGAPWAARTLALAPRRRHRRTARRAWLPRRPARRAHLRREADRAAPAPRHDVGGRPLRRAAISRLPSAAWR